MNLAVPNQDEALSVDARQDPPAGLRHLASLCWSISLILVRFVLWNPMLRLLAEPRSGARGTRLGAVGESSAIARKSF